MAVYNDIVQPGSVRAQIVQGLDTPLEKGVKVDDAETLGTWGTVGYIDPATGTWKAGMADNYMPLYLISSQNDYDAGGSGLHTSVGINWSKYGNKYITAIVATGGFEVQTPAYVDGETYTPNTHLTVSNGVSSGDVAADRGKVKPGVAFDDVIVGIVSGGDIEGSGTTGTLTNEFGAAVVQFWTYYLPATSNSLVGQ